MFWWTLLWLLLALTVAGAGFGAGWEARGNDDFQRFLSKLDHRGGDDPPGPGGVKARR